MIEHPDKIKLLFFIFDLGNGGAEKVLINLVNNLDPLKYDITIRTIFSGGVNVSRLNKNIKYSSFFKISPISGVTRIFRLLSPSFLYNLFIKGKYDIEIAFMHHHPTRIITGFNNNSKKFAWVHTVIKTKNHFLRIYRNEQEFYKLYNNLDKLAFVSKEALIAFEHFYKVDTVKEIVYNVNEYSKIKSLSLETLDIKIDSNIINFISLGRLSPEKGYGRLINVCSNLLKNGYKNWHLYILGDGGLRSELESKIEEKRLEHYITLLGFQNNPYKYLSKMDLYICSSTSEGLSTAATEAISLGIPILSTDCGGMKEIIGETNAGLIVENNEKGLEDGLKRILANPNHLNEMKIDAKRRSSFFSTEKAIRQFEEFIGTA